MNIFTRFKASLLGTKGYINLIKDGISKAFLHLLILALITSSVLSILFINMYNQKEKDIINGLSQSENDFKYENSELKYENEHITFDEGESVFIIDTRISVDNYDSIKNIIVHKDSATVFAKDGIIVKMMSNDLTLKYKDLFMGDLKLDNSSLIDLIQDNSNLKYLIIVFIFISALFNKVYYALILSFIGAVINLVNRINIPYKDIFKMSAYSLTLVTLLELIIPVGSFTVFISGVYIILAMNNIRRNKLSKDNIIQ